MRSANRIPTVSDEAFRRWSERVAFNDAKKLERLKKQSGDDLTNVVESFIARIDVDPTKTTIDASAPDGRCERCGEAFERTEKGRIADHTCPDVVPPSEAEKATAVRDAALALERPRRVKNFGYDDDED